MTVMLVQVREILPSYRSGPLPKVFKVLPKFEAWEEVCEFCLCSRVVFRISIIRYLFGLFEFRICFGLFNIRIRWLIDPQLVECRTFYTVLLVN